MTTQAPKQKKGLHERDKALYQQLRQLSCEQLWRAELLPFTQADPKRRVERVGVIRAAGVVFSHSGSPEQKQRLREWLFSQLHDPSEKIRRYAMAALPKLGAGPRDEAELLALLRASPIERERKFLTQVLEKIGGQATLEALTSAVPPGAVQAERKVKARLARNTTATLLDVTRTCSEFQGVQINLHCRAGLESFVSAEIQQMDSTRARFNVTRIGRGLVEISAVAPFSLADVHTFRCFSTAAFLLGTAPSAAVGSNIDSLTAVITSSQSLRLFNAFTRGPIRYRLDFVSRGHQRAAVRQIADRAYAFCPEIMNDPQHAPWTIAIDDGRDDCQVELIPKLTPDPRFSYRRGDVPASSHPPLAACMARLAGTAENEVVWDPFCGSALELIERARLGGVSQVYGTDSSAAAIEVARKNFAAAQIPSTTAEFNCRDFRAFARTVSSLRGSVSLVITNPPMGKRVPVPNLRALMMEFFSAAALALRPGGRLVLANPLKIEKPHPSLKLQFRQPVDLGIGICRLEKYVRTG